MSVCLLGESLVGDVLAEVRPRERELLAGRRGQRCGGPQGGRGHGHQEHAAPGRHQRPVGGARGATVEDHVVGQTGHHACTCNKKQVNTRFLRQFFLFFMKAIIMKLFLKI